MNIKEVSQRIDGAGWLQLMRYAKYVAAVISEGNIPFDFKEWEEETKGGNLPLKAN